MATKAEHNREMHKQDQGGNCQNDTVVMPRELTAENGAKAALIGEFKQRIPVFCPACTDPIDKEDCLTCGGEGELMQEVNISWDNIKAIYAKAVKHLEIKRNHRYMYFGGQKKRRCADCSEIEA